MSNIVNFPGNESRDGDVGFMQCTCTPEGSVFVAVAIAGDRPIISGVMCPECETQFDVVNGIVQELVDGSGD